MPEEREQRKSCTWTLIDSSMSTHINMECGSMCSEDLYDQVQPAFCFDCGGRIELKDFD